MAISQNEWLRLIRFSACETFGHHLLGCSSCFNTEITPVSEWMQFYKNSSNLVFLPLAGESATKTNRQKIIEDNTIHLDYAWGNAIGRPRHQRVTDSREVGGWARSEWIRHGEVWRWGTVSEGFHLRGFIGLQDGEEQPKTPKRARRYEPRQRGRA